MLRGQYFMRFLFARFYIQYIVYIISERLIFDKYHRDLRCAFSQEEEE